MSDRHTLRHGWVRVWDLPTRLFHWTLVLLLILLWVSGEIGGLGLSYQGEVLGMPVNLLLGNMDIHMLLGQAVLALVLFRLIWGVVGSSTARFAGFVRGPRSLMAYVAAVARGEVPATTGHNPAGAVVILAMLTLLLVQGGLGLFANDDIFSEGPLAARVGKATSDALTVWHGQVFTVLLAVVALHVAAALYYLARGKNLIRPMVTGRKPADTVPPGDPEPRLASPWLALPVLAVAVAIVWAVVTKV
ncbi:cytochrome b/b6 domain-containing protein [Novispirillum sp. DQ9]|uniref:cytochrome b/b6 domain-containing protein n=1 Tax=Novispirillum sp. DQ9 TaxID=3398612 RepID=UPI003C7A9D5A